MGDGNAGAASAAQQTVLLGYVLAAVLLIDLAIAAVWAYRRFVRHRATFARVWSAADVWFGFQIVAGLVIVIFLPLMAFAYLMGVKSGDFEHLTSPRVIRYVLLPSALLQNVAFFVVPAAFVNLKYGLPLRAIGLPPFPRRRDWVAGILLGILGMALSQIISMGAEAVAHHFEYVSWVKAALDIDRTNPVAGIEKILPRLGVSGLIWAVLGIGIGAPLGEEMLFRGFVFNALKRRFGVAAGLILSSLCFTLPHSYGLGLLPVFMLGLLMAWAYHNSGSLWVTVILHATNNTVQVLLAFFLPSLLK